MAETEQTDVSQESRPSRGLLGFLFSLLADAFRFFGVVVLGVRDSTRVYERNLRAAERYVRWAREREDVRDYLTAIDYCQACEDRDAPKPDLLLRKYSVYIEALVAVMRHTVERFRVRRERTLERVGELREELAAAHEAIDRLRKEVERLQREGAPTRAQETTTRAQSLEKRLAQLEFDRPDVPALEDLAQENHRAASELFHRIGQFEVAVSALQQTEDVDIHSREQLMEASRREVSRLRTEFERLKPEAPPAPAASDQPPAPEASEASEALEKPEALESTAASGPESAQGSTEAQPPAEDAQTPPASPGPGAQGGPQQEGAPQTEPAPPGSPEAAPNERSEPSAPRQSR